MDNSITVGLVLPNKTPIRVEATPIRRPGDTDVGFRTMPEDLTVENVQDAIEGIGEMVVGALHRLAPRKVAVEFALEIGLESGKLTALWVKGTGKANLKITLEWDGTSSRGLGA